MRTLELTASGILGSLAIFLVAAVCVRLGFWQLDRREERLARNAAIAERLAQPLVSLSGSAADTVGLVHRRATVRGRYDTPRTLVLGGRSRNGAPGVHVLAPLRTGDGGILVNRGWLPARDAATVDLEAVAVDTAVTVTGVLLPLPETGAVPPAEGFRQTWFRLDADPVRAQFPYPLSPLYLQAEAADGPAAAPRSARDGPIPVRGPSLEAGPHLSYAFQWFGFAIVFVVGWAALVMRETRGTAPGRGNIGSGGALSEPDP